MPTSCRFLAHAHALAVFGLAGLLALPSATSAGDNVEWRKDYDSARKEAVEKGKPLFIDFGTEECVHCRRLDVSTFRDPGVVKLLKKQRFIPLKVDANREPHLTQALRIQIYPTMILAGNDGKIITWVEGYMESPRLLEHLTRACSIQTPDWMGRDYNEAAKAITVGDYSRAITLLKGVAEDGKNLPVQTKARETLAELETHATNRLAQAHQLESKGQNVEAVDALTDLLRRYAGTKAADDGAKLLTSLADKPDIRHRQRSRRAQELLAQAKEDCKAGRYLHCLDICELLQTAYKEFQESTQGAELAIEVKTDPERMAKVCEAMNQRLSDMYLSLAETWLKKGDRDQAAACLDKVVKVNPRSSSAMLAQAKLDDILKRTPATLTNFNKP